MNHIIQVLGPLMLAALSLQIGHYAVGYWGWMHHKDLAVLHKQDATLGIMIAVTVYSLLVAGGLLGSPWLALTMLTIGVLGSIWARKNHNALRAYIRLKRRVKRRLHCTS